MDSSITAALPAIATLVGGVYGGFKVGKSQSLTDTASVASISADTIDMLQAQVEVLTEGNSEKAHNIAELMTRVSILESMITQRAEVEEVHATVNLIKNKVDEIHEAIVV